jgi:hypothetical protein
LEVPKALQPHHFLQLGVRVDELSFVLDLLTKAANLVVAVWGLAKLLKTSRKRKR